MCKKALNQSWIPGSSVKGTDSIKQFSMKDSLCREIRVQMSTNGLDFLTKITVHAYTQHGGDKVK